MAVIRQRTQVFNQPVGVVRADAGAASVGQAISRAAGTMAQLSFQEAAKDAQKKGIELAQAVEEKKLRTINPETGKPEAYTPPESFGTIAADAYQSVIDKRFEDSMATELKLKAQELALNYQFNAEAYDEVMSDYIGSMAENAEGKYKAFIESTGTKFLALTKLNIQERAVARSRANAAQSIIVGIDDGADNAYATALAGGYMARDGEQFSEAALIRDREVGNAKNGIGSGLIKAGADTRASQQINESIARGAIEHIMSKTYSSSERNAVIRALRTRGNQLGGVPQNLQDEVKSALEFIDASNVESVLSHGSTVSADYNAVERDIAAQQKAAAEAAARRAEISYSNSMLDYSTQATNLAVGGFDGETPFMVSTSVMLASERYMQLKNVVDDRFAMDQITSDERDSNLRDARQEALRPMLIQAAGQGNVQEFRVALNTRNPKDMARLTSQQREFISAIHSSDIFLPEDIGFAREVLSASDNQIRNQLEREQLRYSTSTAVTDAVEAAQQGALSQDDLDKIIKDIRTNIGPNGLTADQALSEEGRLMKGFAFGVVEMFSSDATSSDMNNLATYIESNGQRTEGMSQAIIDAGNEVLQATSEEQRGEVIGKIKSLKTTIDSNEQEIKDEIELMQNQKRILGGNGSANNRKDRELSQEMLEFHGVDVSKFFSYPETAQAAALKIMRSAPPQNLVDFLKDIASGVAVQDTENYLKLFAMLESDPTDTGIFVNRFGSSLNEGEVEMLRDINRIRTTTGGNSTEIAQTLVERMSDPASTRRMNELFDKKSAVQFVTDYTDDSFIANELGPVAEYMALTGKTKTQIEGRIDQIIDQRYPKSRHIVDPRYPVGSIKRSRHALSLQFPEKEERMAFLQHIAASLPRGYQLVPNLDAGEKKVYLRPDDTTAEVRYFAYFVDENKELRPLIFDRDGERYFPSFSKADIADYYAEQERKAQAELDRLEQEQQGVFQRSKLLKKRPGIRSADPFGR